MAYHGKNSGPGYIQNKNRAAVITRRDFIKVTGAGILAASSSGCSPILTIRNPTPTTPLLHASPIPSTKTATPLSIPTASPVPQPTQAPRQAQVAFVKTTDRADGVRRALDLLGINPVAGKTVLLKPNFNSADPTPGSTHDDVLRTL
ncbi:MAG: twin-arginine translocation signal domain-containing protein, partial [Anaerolineae bacterium]|nr:twin-arginine translocation signal domain-containing protein [Anaerolineae bacterium]